MNYEFVLVLKDTEDHHGIEASQFRDLPFKVSINKIYSEQEAIKIIHATGMATHPGLLRTVRDKILADYPDASFATQAQLADTAGGYYLVYLLFKDDGSDPGYKKQIKRFMDKFQHLCEDKINEASGDEDYHTFTPSFLDMYYQACEVFYDTARYTKWFDNLIDTN